MIHIRKSKPRPVYKAKKKSTAGQHVLEKLNNFLKGATEEPTYFLTHFWSDQQQAITYRELREAIMNGYLDAQTLAEWQQDYSKLVVDKLGPMWTAAMDAANDEMKEIYEFIFDPTSDAVQSWISKHGSEFVTRVTIEQEQAINALLSHASAGSMTVDELSRAIRPVVGLTKPQATANLNYYSHVKASLMENNPTMKETTAAKRAREASLKYAAKQHRYRAYSIAQTELAYAYNQGAHEGVIQAQGKGLLGKMNKKWSTALNEGVCEICGALEGKEVPMDAYFEIDGLRFFIPPAHPGCHCAVEYVEAEEV
ncbi:MAG: phage minor head protein [Oscillospiraceae bacterium]|nr:phage minor head protein [Oscillospiraceae bacterium]